MKVDIQNTKLEQLLYVMIFNNLEENPSISIGLVQNINGYRQT